MSAIRLTRVINGFVHWTGSERTYPQKFQALPCYIDIVIGNIAAKSLPAKLLRGDYRGPDPHIGIKHRVAWCGEGKYKPFHQLDWELTRMDCFLNMIVLHVWKNPNVPRIFSKWVAR